MPGPCRVHKTHYDARTRRCLGRGLQTHDGTARGRPLRTVNRPVVAASLCCNTHTCQPLLPPLSSLCKQHRRRYCFVRSRSRPCWHWCRVSAPCHHSVCIVCGLFVPPPPPRCCKKARTQNARSWTAFPHAFPLFQNQLTTHVPSKQTHTRPPFPSLALAANCPKAVGTFDLGGAKCGAAIDETSEPARAFFWDDIAPPPPPPCLIVPPPSVKKPSVKPVHLS